MRTGLFNSCFGGTAHCVLWFLVITCRLVLGSCTSPKLKVLSWVICVKTEATGSVSSLYYDAAMPGYLFHESATNNNNKYQSSGQWQASHVRSLCLSFCLWGALHETHSKSTIIMTIGCMLFHISRFIFSATWGSYLCLCLGCMEVKQQTL